MSEPFEPGEPVNEPVEVEETESADADEETEPAAEPL